jgi:ABC-type multidrug transport system fused ATPase/permease subunit
MTPTLASSGKLTRPPKSLLGGLGRLLAHLSKRRRCQLGGLLLVMLAGAVAELATLGAVVPVLALLADPAVATKFSVLQRLFGQIGWTKSQDILLPATILFALIAVTAAAMRMVLAWGTFKFTFGVGADIGVEVYRRTLYQPYSFHVARNTSEIIAGLNKVQTVVHSVISPLVQGVVALVLASAILGALVSIDPATAVVAGLGFGIIYVVVTITTRRQLRGNSRILAENETRRVQSVQEGLGGIRDVLIDGTQGVYIDRFWRIEAAQSRARAANNFISTAPRFLIESIGMVLIAGLAYWLSRGPGGMAAAVPVLGALAIGAQKLMPLMQQVYYGWASLSGNRSVLVDVLDLIDQPIPVEYSVPLPVPRPHLKLGIKLRHVSFRYHPESRDVVRRLTLEIPRGSRVGFVGKTGSGKSTLIDLVMGLLEPSAGSVEVDGQTLTSSNRRAWQAHLAHVPQSIYLADTSIAENIAFGADPREIDLDRVREAARHAQLSEFIEDLPSKYRTIVGERGVRLSGGQRQRIGLARALYKRADVLVLDEATSALDDETERAVMQAIDSLGEEITVLMIAHRTSTLGRCDRIFELKDGILVRSCSYQELLQTMHNAETRHHPSKV